MEVSHYITFKCKISNKRLNRAEQEHRKVERILRKGFYFVYKTCLVCLWIANKILERFQQTATNVLFFFQTSVLSRFKRARELNVAVWVESLTHTHSLCTQFLITMHWFLSACFLLVLIMTNCVSLFGNICWNLNFDFSSWKYHKTFASELTAGVCTQFQRSFDHL